MTENPRIEPNLSLVDKLRRSAALADAQRASAEASQTPSPSDGELESELRKLVNTRPGPPAPPRPISRARKNGGDRIPSVTERPDVPAIATMTAAALARGVEQVGMDVRQLLAEARQAFDELEREGNAIITELNQRSRAIEAKTSDFIAGLSNVSVAVRSASNDVATLGINDV